MDGASQPLSKYNDFGLVGGKSGTRQLRLFRQAALQLVMAIGYQDHCAVGWRGAGDMDLVGRDVIFAYVVAVWPFSPGMALHRVEALFGFASLVITDDCGRAALHAAGEFDSHDWLLRIPKPTREYSG